MADQLGCTGRLGACCTVSMREENEGKQALCGLLRCVRDAEKTSDRALVCDKKDATRG